MERSREGGPDIVRVVRGEESDGMNSYMRGYPKRKTIKTCI